MMNSLEPERKTKSPSSPNEVRVARYFYGVSCPHCKDTSPIIEKVNSSLRGGRIEYIATDEKWSEPKMKHNDLGSQTPKAVKGTLGERPLEVTPTIFWEDGMVTEGAPYTDNNEINIKETREYICVRSAKCFLKETRPDIGNDDIRELCKSVFEGRIVMEERDGEWKRNPYKGLREITRRY